MSSSKEARKHKASTRLTKSGKTLAKKLRHADKDRLAPPSPASTTSNLSRQTSTSSLQSRHTTPPRSPSPTTEDIQDDEEDPDNNAEDNNDEAELDGGQHKKGDLGDSQEKLGASLYVSDIPINVS